MKILWNIAICMLFCGILFAQEAPEFGGTIRVATSADISTVYPWEMTDTETMMVFQNVYEPLIRLKKHSADMEPALATHWEVSKDFKKWTFHLRKNVKFHDGSPFNANSVIDSLSLKKNLPAKMKKIDNSTIVFELEKPDAAFAITISIEYHSIVGPPTIKCYKEKCENPVAVGTGPYTFYKWEPTKQVILRANENYWGGRPFIDEAIFIPFKINSELMKALKNKTIDLAQNILPSNIAEVRKTPNLNFQSIPAMSVGYLAMNAEKAPFDNSKVRIAVSYAINKKELVNKYFYGRQAALVAKSCLPISMFGYHADLEERAYDPAKAKALLKEAGYPNGFETTLLPPPVARPYMPEPLKMAEDVKKYLADVGIKATIVNSKSFSTFLDVGYKGDYDMMLFGWIADTIDPNDFLTSLLSKAAIGTSNTTRWSHPQFEYMLETARNQSISARVKTYQEAQILFNNEMPFIPLVYAMQLATWNDRVKGYKLHPATRFYLQNIWISE
ncbi:MAG: hypothetical protein A2Y62_16195 [Candidatus Fischerbacteria bacterium RBG_13_37_8]|uniref:Solute-binding protein family 5 domain-containing protein n=1 Tax=Candidatus Fischerbacteria bacterium RBG_13_37_8 TaxID=1817863 RepID=A0A1F5VDZ7_9BACT|nr:MAG: hypothetical protein A2Y62_16195 [Candidatus Fischerbacteria bacterium RBG_13_37_8]